MKRGTEGADDSNVKRVKPNEEEVSEGTEYLSKEISTKIDQYIKSYRNVDLPFPAVPMDELFDDAKLRAVREEVISNLEADLKNCDLYEKLQSLDIRNLVQSEDAETSKKALEMPHLVNIYKEISSDSFKSHIARVTGLELSDLAGETDATVHLYGEGHHLLIHDDDIGSRKVAFIIYLTDPEDQWTEEDGGSLELYPIQDGQPTHDPVIRLLPTWNRMSIFEVQPNTSWHAVQEIRSSYKLRLSIQGWYHAKERDTTRNELSMKDIIAMREKMFRNVADNLPTDEADTDEDEEPVEEESVLSRKDLNFLSQHFSVDLLKRDNVLQYRSQFMRCQGILIIQELLKPEIVTELMTKLFDEKDHLHSEENAEVVEPPTFHRYVRWSDHNPLDDWKEKLFNTVHFRRFLTEITGLDFHTAYIAETRQFRRGLDYTLAIAPSEESRLDVTFTMIDDRTAEKQAIWEAAEVGGNQIIVPAKTEVDDYTSAVAGNDNDQPLVFETKSNSLSIILRPRETPAVQYTKFIKSKAPSDRWDINCEFMLFEAEESESCKEEEVLPAEECEQKTNEV